MTEIPGLTLVVHELARTGAPSFALRQVEQLRARDWSVSAIAKEGGSLAEAFTDKNIPLTVLQTGHLRRLSRGEITARAAEALAKTPHGLVYVHSLAAAEFCAAAAAIGRHCILHVHEMPPLIRDLKRAGIWGRDFSPPLAGLIGASESGLEYAARLLKVQQVPRMVCMNTIDIGRVRDQAEGTPAPAINRFGKALSKVNARPLLVMCGAATPAKGTDVFLRAAKRRPNWDFLWVGPFVPIDRRGQTFADQIARRGSDNLFTTGVVESPASWIARSDIFVFTSFADANPTVVLEALALRKPVIAFEGGLGETANVAHLGTLLPGKPRASRLVAAADLLLQQAGRLTIHTLNDDELTRLIGGTSIVDQIDAFLRDSISRAASAG